jgi:hypothetical protein
VITSTIEDWVIKVKGTPPYIFVYNEGILKKKINIEEFEEFGMSKFPKKLHMTIACNIKNSNTYDRFMDKFYEFWDNRFA